MANPQPILGCHESHRLEGLPLSLVCGQRIDCGNLSYGASVSPRAGMQFDNPVATTEIRPDVRVGFVLSPSFTLLAFAGFVDTLRHSADKGDRSRQIHCHWTILGADLEPVRSSCGAAIRPWRTIGNPSDFDYVVIVGGLTPAFREHRPETFDFLRLAGKQRIPVVGLCTGSFAMAEAGLLDGKRCAVHIRHRDEFEKRYPGVTVSTHDVFVIDGEAITCPGGVAAIDLAVELISRHTGRLRARKGLVEMSVDRVRTSGDQVRTPHEELLSCGDWRVERAVRRMRSNFASRTTIRELARQLGVSVSQLERAFSEHTDMTPSAVWREMRLLEARRLLLNTSNSVSQVAASCGFADSSHLHRWFRRAFGETPHQARRVRQKDISAASTTADRRGPSPAPGS